MSSVQLTAGPPVQYNLADEAMFSKIDWRLLPLLITCFIVAFLDRINIAFAQLQMKQSLAFGDAGYALGAGLFFIGYFLFEVPSNLMLARIGARKTLLRIMFCWGVVAAGMSFVQTPVQFYILRFLLGAFEAGFFPGVILYLTFWYPSARRARVVAIFMTGATVAYLIAGPVSGAIMKYMDGLLSYHGWQWLFVVQGLPASVLGIVCYLYLQDKPHQANWLTVEEKASLNKHLTDDTGAVAPASHNARWGMLRDPNVYTLAFAYFLLLGATYAIVFRMPTMIRSWGVQDLFLLGWLTALPPLFGLVGMVLFGRSSDRYQERRKHYFATVAIAATGLLITIFFQGNLVGSLAGLCVLMIGQSSATPLFFTTLSEYVPKKTAAGGIALISSLGNLGPAVMPSVTSWVNTATGTSIASMYLVIVLFLMSGAILYRVVGPRLQ